MEKSVKYTRLITMALALIILLITFTYGIIRLFGGAMGVSKGNIDIDEAGYLSVYLLPDEEEVHLNDLYGRSIYEEAKSGSPYKYSDAEALIAKLKEVYPQYSDTIDAAFSEALDGHKKGKSRLKRDEFYALFEKLSDTVMPQGYLKKTQGYLLEEWDASGTKKVDRTLLSDSAGNLQLYTNSDAYKLFGKDREKEYYKFWSFYVFGDKAILDLEDNKENEGECDFTLPACYADAGNDPSFKTFIYRDKQLGMNTFGEIERFPEGGTISDIFVKDGKIVSYHTYTEYVSGKVLRVTDDHIELEGVGKLPYVNDFPLYKLYGKREFYTFNDIRVGYDFGDFCVNDEGVIVAGRTTEPEIMENVRILIKTTNFNNAYHDYVTLSSDSGLIVNGSIRKEAGEKINFMPGDEFFKNTDRVYVECEDENGRIKIDSIERGNGIPSYRGKIEIVKDDEGLFVVNEVKINEYLYNVVPSEMPVSYPEEALKVQAVCARNYIYERLLHSKLKRYGVNADDSAACQVYGNTDEDEKANAAVDATGEEIIKDREGNVAEIFYYSTSCGCGTDLDAWNGEESREYLIPRHYTLNTARLGDPFSTGEREYVDSLTDESTFRDYIDNGNEEDVEYNDPWYRWTYESSLDIDRLNEKLLNVKGKNYNYITDIGIVERLPGGVASKLWINGDSGEYFLHGENDIRTVLSNSSDKVVRKDESSGPASGTLPSAFFYIDTKKDENGHVTDIILKGGGFGHGIGMSQNGARYMAEAGMSCDEIIEAYFPGTVLTEINEE